MRLSSFVSFRRSRLTYALLLTLVGLTSASVASNKPAPIKINSLDWAASGSFGTQPMELVQMDIDNNGALGPLFVHLTVKSKNGLIRTLGERTAVPAGNHVKVQIRVFAPVTFFGTKTDTILATLSDGTGKTIDGPRRFQREIIWPENIPQRSPDPRFLTDWRNERGYINAIEANFFEHASAANDEIFAQLTASKEEDLDGELKVGMFPIAVNDILSANRNDTKILVEEWVSSSPKSIAAAITKSMYLRYSAWAIYGGRNNLHPDPMAVKLFHLRMKAAARVLLNSKPNAAANPVWYQTYLEILIDDGETDSRIEQVFDEATKKFRTYRPLYVAMAQHWAPRYGAQKWDKVRELVALAIGNTEQHDGTGLYSIIYTALTNDHLIDFEPFRDSPATWPEFKASLEDLMRRYPNADSLKNQYASFACRAGDKATFNTAWYKLGPDFIPSQWYENYRPDVCTSQFMEKA